MTLLTCRPPVLVEASADWRLEPASLEFPATVVGQERRLSVTLTNASRVNGVMLLEVAAPFSAPPRLEVPAGESVVFDVFFLPRETGVATQTVQLRSSTQTVSLELSARATAPVSCPAATAPCRATQPTPEGLCVEVDAVDGQGCSSPCIENGSCRQGQCVGRARGCDDRDACTADACDELRGCTHLPVVCAAPSSPCQAAQCNAASGCSAVEVADGTPCGANTCLTAKVCVAGQCREVPSPDGSSCAPATACRGAGACRQGACLVPPATTLGSAWTYQVPAGSTLTFPGVGDRAGNVYWLETVGGTTQLVSVDFDGVERFRARMAGAANPGASWPAASSPLMLVSETQLVVLLRDESPANGPGHRIEARSAVDGSLQWSRARADLVAPLGLTPGLPLWVTSAGVVGAGRVFLTLRTNAGGAAWTSWLVALEASNGALAWKAQSQYLTGAVADESSVYTSEDLGHHTLKAFSYDGALRWSLDAAGTPTSASAGKLFLVNPSMVRDAQTGALTQAAPNPAAAHEIDGVPRLPDDGVRPDVVVEHLVMQLGLGRRGGLRSAFHRRHDEHVRAPVSRQLIPDTAARAVGGALVAARPEGHRVGAGHQERVWPADAEAVREATVAGNHRPVDHRPEVIDVVVQGPVELADEHHARRGSQELLRQARALDVQLARVG